MSVAIIDAEGDYGVVIVSGANLQIAKEDVRKSRDLIQHATVLVLENEILDARIFSLAFRTISGAVAFGKMCGFRSSVTPSDRYAIRCRHVYAEGSLALVPVVAAHSCLAPFWLTQTYAHSGGDWLPAVAVLLTALLIRMVFAARRVRRRFHVRAWCTGVESTTTRRAPATQTLSTPA
jgi:hypothetical protein